MIWFKRVLWKTLFIWIRHGVCPCIIWRFCQILNIRKFDNYAFVWYLLDFFILMFFQFWYMIKNVIWIQFCRISCNYDWRWRKLNLSISVCWNSVELFGPKNWGLEHSTKQLMHMLFEFWAYIMQSDILWL